MSEVRWTVGGGDGTSVPSPSVSSDKHPYVTEKRITEGASPGQQDFIRVYNSMRSVLIKNGLMEDKK